MVIEGGDMSLTQEQILADALDRLDSILALYLIDDSSDSRRIINAKIYELVRDVSPEWDIIQAMIEMLGEDYKGSGMDKAMLVAACRCRATECPAIENAHFDSRHESRQKLTRALLGCGQVNAKMDFRVLDLEQNLPDPWVALHRTWTSPHWNEDTRLWVLVTPWPRGDAP